MTQLIGIVNLTPDSFSDGGKYTSVETALHHAEELMAAGAAMVDVGAESTRPGATPLTAAEEWQRLAPVLEQLCRRGIPVSLDSYHPENIKKALALGISWVNDVTGFSNPQMVEAVKDSTARVILMHNLGVPANPSRTLPQDEDAVALVLQWAQNTIQRLMQQGIAKERIIFDPGIGFGKTATQSLAILKRIDEYHRLGVKLLVGHSRKSCFSLLTGSNAKDRDPETYATSLYLAEKGVQFLRVHEVGGNKRALQVFGYLSGGNA